MITDNEKFIEIQAILASSNINTRDCAKINDLIIELSKENQQLKKVIDKAIEFINECMKDENDDTDIDIVTCLLAYKVDELLDILKEVE